MSRRADPGRIYAAQRAGVFRRLVDAERVNELEAEELISGWEAEAERRVLSSRASGYWDQGWDWMRARRSARHR